MTIRAFDKQGNIFEKEVTLRNGTIGPVVSLGFPCEWYIGDIQTPPSDNSNEMCIDAAGRNHKGSAVYVLHSELIDKIAVLEKENTAALLKDAVNGTSPSYDAMEIPVVRKYGSYTGGFKDEWNWYSLEKATFEELTEIYSYTKKYYYSKKDKQ